MGHITESVCDLVKAVLSRYKALTNKKNFVDKLPFPNHLAQHALKLLARISLRNVTQPPLERNKYIIVTSDVFSLQNAAFKGTAWTAIVMKKDTMGHALIYSELANSSIDNI